MSESSDLSKADLTKEPDYGRYASMARRNELSERVAKALMRHPDFIDEVAKRLAALQQPVDVRVVLPNEIRMVPAETETVSERRHDGLVVRSVTRPTKQDGTA